MNAAPCGSDLTSIGGVPEKCCRISPNPYYNTISIKGTSPQGRPQAQGLLTSFVLKYRGPGHIYITQVGGRIGGAAKREEVDPTDSQFLQAQGHITSFILKYKGPGHSIP